MKQGDKEKYFNKGFLVGALIVGTAATIAFIMHLFQQH